MLVNNAGGQPLADVATASPFHPGDRRDQPPILFSQQAYRVMADQASGGSTINISSQVSLPGGGGGLAPYGAAKAGLNHMTGSLAGAWGRKVRVNCVSHGWVRTEVMVDLLLSGEEEAKASEKIPVGRMGPRRTSAGSACSWRQSRPPTSTVPPSVATVEVMLTES